MASNTFNNEVARQWINEFTLYPGMENIKLALHLVIKENNYIQTDEAYECLAACEVIARLGGHWGVKDEYSQDIDNWVENTPIQVGQEIKNKAIIAIEKILGNWSILAELNADNEDWKKNIQDLKNRI